MASAPEHDETRSLVAMEFQADHPVRMLDMVHSQVDWSRWERHYLGRRGQPAIHPRLLAGAILYGLIKRIRSSRQLEEATQERIDFRWFLEGRTNVF